MGLGLGRRTRAAADASAKREKRVQAVPTAELSPAIRDLIQRFTVVNGEGTFDRTSFARRPLRRPEAPPPAS
jgi:hypothetical protein